MRVLVPDAPVTVTGDADRLAQVVGNLLDNAARATGGAGAVSVSVDRTGDEAVVRVTDDGPGVPEADRERIFDRLVRLDAGRDDRSGGAGLGLPIARGIARAHGGDLVCPPGGPTAFVLTVPAVRAAGTPAVAPAPLAEAVRSLA